MKRRGGRAPRSVKRVKQLVAIGVGALTVLGGLMILRQAGAAVLRSSEGADPRTAFRRSITAPVEIRGAIKWLPDRQYEGRLMEPLTRDAISDAYAQAWSALNRAAQGDPEAPVGEYFSGPALDHVRRLMSNGVVRSTSVTTTHVSHTLQLTFYSDDGSVVSFDAPEVMREQLVRATVDDKPQATVAGTTSTTTIAPLIDADGANYSAGTSVADTTETVARTVEAYRLVMLLRDGNWRVELIERTASEAPRLATEWTTPDVSTTTVERTPITRPSTTAQQRDSRATTTTINTARREWRR
jgi:hypothetical protein